jgi:hypothetical protein
VLGEEGGDRRRQDVVADEQRQDRAEEAEGERLRKSGRRAGRAGGAARADGARDERRARTRGTLSVGSLAGHSSARPRLRAHARRVGSGASARLVWQPASSCALAPARRSLRASLARARRRQSARAETPDASPV